MANPFSMGGPLAQNPLNLDPQSQRIQQLMMQQQGAQQQPPMGVQDDLAQQAQPQGGMLTGKDERALQNIRNSPITGMDQIMSAKTPTAGLALAKTLGAAASGYMGKKQKTKEEEAVRTELKGERERESVALQEEKDFRQEGRVLEERRVKIQEDLALAKTQAAKNLVIADAAKLKDEREYDKGQLEAKQAHDKVVRQEIQTRKDDDAEFERDLDYQKDQDDGTKALLGRRQELERALPAAIRLAGMAEERGTPDDRNIFQRYLTGGTGPVAGMMPMDFSDDTATMRALSGSEALRTIGNLDTPLTPVSDRDMITITGVGISVDKSDEKNLALIEQAMADIDYELKARVREKKASPSYEGKSLEQLRKMAGE